MMQYDIFISHASEDKMSVAHPLAELLTKAGLKVWLDAQELTLGDSLRRKIDNGLSKSAYGVVILSRDFFKKEWPQKELDALVAREDGREKVILPIRHNLSHAEILSFSPLLADRLSTNTSSGIDAVANEILKAVRSDIRYESNPKVVIPKLATDYLIQFLVMSQFEISP